MRHIAALACAALLCGPALAQSPAAKSVPDYAVIAMSIDVDRPATQAWAKVGKYCDLGAWLKIDCTITQGTGDIGSVRSIAGGRVTEVLVARTDLSYGYTQPAVAGKPYDLYHGFLEARPLSATRTRLIYTLLYDVSLAGDQAARDTDKARRRALFEGALRNMKAIAEAK